MNPYFEELFCLHSRGPSDINEHLKTLRDLADECHSVLELGTRWGSSTSAFLVSDAKILHCVDLIHTNCRFWDDVAYQIAQMEECPKEFAFFRSDTLEWEPARESYDMIFIDDFHEGTHLEQELAKYGPLASQYLVFHDTETFGWQGERRGNGPSLGIRHAIINYLLDYEDGWRWTVKHHFANNNGLTVLECI